MSGEDFLEQVKREAEQAINEELDGDSDETGGGLLTPTEMVSRGWNTDEYNDFFGDCRTDGYSASDCGEMWSLLSDSGGDTSRESVGTTGADVPEGSGHVLLVKEGSDGSDVAVSHLAKPAAEGELEVALVGEDRGQELLEAVDQVPDVPAHLHITDNGVEVRPLKALFREFLVE